MSEDADWKELVNPPLLGEVEVRLGIEFDRPNGNNRVYPRHVWEKAMQDAHRRVNERTLFVYDGEPTLNNAVAIVQEVAERDGQACAGVKFLDTPKGIAVRQLIEHGNVNFFSCGIGSVRDGVVQEDYQIEHIGIQVSPRNIGVDQIIVRQGQEPA